MPGMEPLMLAEGSMPKLPVSMEASSDKMSPKMFPVTMVSNSRGFRSSCIAQLSTYLHHNILVRALLDSRQGKYLDSLDW